MLLQQLNKSRRGLEVISWLTIDDIIISLNPKLHQYVFLLQILARD